MLSLNLFKRTDPVAASTDVVVPIAEPTQHTTTQSAMRALRSMRTQVRSMFTSASSDRLTASWPTMPQPADWVIDKNQRTLVARSREQSANNDFAKAFLRMCRQNIVGSSGIMMQAQVKKRNGKLDAKANEAIENAFFEWSKAENCDVTGKRDLRSILNSVVTTAARDGEFMVRMVTGADAGPWGFALQTLDPQRCPVDFNEDKPRSGEAFIRQGIGFNRYGRPLSYFFTTVEETTDTWIYGGRAYVRIPADDLVHGYIEEFEGQKRGLPWMATSLFRMRHLNGWEDAAIVNARVGAAKMGFIKWKDGFGPEYEDEDSIPEISAEAGVFETLPEGAEIHDWSPQYPSGEFSPFTKYMLRGMAAGMGVPYNELAADLEGVNFSSIRQGTLDSREHWKDKQEWLIAVLLLRVHRRWNERALMAGRVVSDGKAFNATKIDAFLAVSFQGRRWQWIDPRADVDAAVNSKNNMLASPGQIIRESGRDPQTVWVETARDLAAMREALVAEGFKDEDALNLVMLSMGREPPKPVPAGKKDEPAKAD